MKVLDLDMDYFMKSVATFINESEPERLPEEDYGDSVWSEREVRNFLEGNLGLSKQNRIRGRVVAGHNESLFFWRELIEKGDLSTPFDVIHSLPFIDYMDGFPDEKNGLWGVVQELLGRKVDIPDLREKYKNVERVIVREEAG